MSQKSGPASLCATCLLWLLTESEVPQLCLQVEWFKSSQPGWHHQRFPAPVWRLVFKTLAWTWTSHSHSWGLFFPSPNSPFILTSSVKLCNQHSWFLFLILKRLFLELTRAENPVHRRECPHDVQWLADWVTFRIVNRILSPLSKLTFYFLWS